MQVRINAGRVKRYDGNGVRIEGNVERGCVVGKRGYREIGVYLHVCTYIDMHITYTGLCEIKY